MFDSIDGFKKAWEDNSRNTLKIFGALTDSSLKQAVAQNHRTIQRISWHIVTTIPEMMGMLGLKFEQVKADSPPPDRASEIKAAYELVSGSLLEQIIGNWNDAALKIVDDLYGEKWVRGLTLRILIDHEIHHRGQLTVLLRQAGLSVPGIFGPALEEWRQYGMKPPEI